MKKLIIRKAFPILLMLFLSASTGLFAQDPPPPPLGGHGQSGNQSPPGGGTPIGSGIAILLALGAVYGGKRFYKHRKQVPSI